MNTLQSTINWAQALIQYSPLTAGTGSEPACTFASMIRNTIMNSPFSWIWNRYEDSSVTTTVGQQDYVVNLTNFGWLEKASLTDPDGKIWEIKDVYNTNTISRQTLPTQRPSAIAVISYIPGVSIKIRFLGVPDKAYTVNLTYQAAATQFGPFTAISAGNASGGNTAYVGIFTPSSFPVGGTAQIAGFVGATNNGTFSVVSVTPSLLVVANASGVSEVAPANAATAINTNWFPIPDQYSDVYNNLFLAEAFQAVSEDIESARYRQRGVAALLAKAEGLTESQKNAFTQQYLQRDAEILSNTLRTNQGTQARGV